MSVSMAEMEGKNFENPAYEAGEQPVANSMVTATKTPVGTNKESINNPLYVEEVQVVDKPTGSVTKPNPTTANKEAFVNPSYGSQIEDADVTSAQPAAPSAQQFEPIGDESFVSFKNPTYTDQTHTSAPDSDI